MLQPIYANVPAVTGSYPASRCISPSAHQPVRCRVHSINCTSICTKCVALLCDTCLATNQHSQCPVINLNTVSGSHCGQIKKKLSSQITHTQSKLKLLHRTLIEKKQRLLQKRGTTAMEIDRYFKRIKEKLHESLQASEKSLLKQLNDSVNEQDDIVSKSIEKCHTSVHTLGEKYVMLENLDRIYTIGNGNSVEHVRNMSQVSHDVSEYMDVMHGLEAARDAFLLLRFFVNTETERTLLNSKIACMEVLNSRSRHHAEGSLESERIAEASSSSGEGSSSSGCQSPVAGEALDEGTNTDTNAGSQEDTVTDSTLNDSNLARQFVNEFATPVSPNNNSSARSSEPNHSANPNSENNSLSGCPTVTGVANTTRRVNNAERRLRSRRDSPDNRMSNDITAATSEDEPPPPYPGMPRVTRPGSNESPPPYPGPPPPPYRQFPESRSSNPRDQHNAVSSTTGRGPQTASRQRPRRPRRPHSPLPEGDGSQRVSIAGRPLKTFTTSELNDKRSAGIFAMVAHDEHSFLIIDRWNKKLKFFTDSGASKGGLIFRQEPWDITRITVDQYAVTVPDLKTIYKVQAGVTAVVTLNTLPTERKYACITYHRNNELFVCGQVPQFGEPVIDLIGIDGGPVLFTFNSDLHGQSLFSYPRYTNVSRDGTAVVCDWNMKCLVLFKLDGTVIGRYRGTRENPLQDPLGIVINQSTNSIYVIDAKLRDSGCCIHRLSLGCKMEEVINVAPEIRDARTITYAGDKLITGSRKGIVHIFTANESNPVLVRQGISTV